MKPETSTNNAAANRVGSTGGSALEYEHAKLARDFNFECERRRELTEALRNLLAQAEEVHRYSSWLAMCEYNQTPDARETARALLSPNARGVPDARAPKP